MKKVKTVIKNVISTSHRGEIPQQTRGFLSRRLLRNDRMTMTTIVAMIILSVLSLFSSKAQATEISAAGFLSSQAYNNIVDDGSYVDTSALDAGQIQSYLTTQNSYLKDFSENGKTAAQIIYEASHGLYDAAIGSSHGISITASTGTVSPKIILIFLQKEQSLITNPNRDDYGLTYAMGYDCPDSTGCTGSAHPGFSEQVGWGAWQLRYNYEAARNGLSWWQAQYPGNSDTYFYAGQDRTISDYTGSYSVHVGNAATASIYRYTPHVFDSAYNVWNFWNSWSWPGPISWNDTGQWDTKTYSELIKVTGLKATDCRLYFFESLVADLNTTTWELYMGPPVGTTVYTLVYKNADGVTVNEKKVNVTRNRLGDIDGNNTIDITDLAIFAENWGAQNPSETLTDLDGSGIVDITDLAIFAENWGR